jgi:hypothetical protein
MSKPQFIMRQCWGLVVEPLLETLMAHGTGKGTNPVVVLAMHGTAHRQTD